METTPLPLPVGTKDTQYEKGDVVAIPVDDRRKHMAIFGKSGTGKTTLMRNMIVWDIIHGQGVTVLDPHGDLIADLLTVVPRHRTNDVVHINPSDPDRAVGINILERPADTKHRDLAVSYLISILKNISGEVGWGHQTEDILRNAATALIEQPQPVSLAAIPKLLTDTDYRARVLKHVTNPIVREYFRFYEEQWDKRERAKAIAAPLNKLRKYLTNPLLRAIIGQTRSTFDFRRAMDNGNIVLCELSKGALGADVSALLGSLIMTKLQLAALSRQDVPEDQRRDHFLYADEVQNFIHGADLPTITAEARKYRLTLTIATQTLDQLPKDALSAVFGNCATIISFRTSGRDAAELKHEFAVLAKAEQIQELGKYKAYVRTLMDGVPKGPLQIDTLPPIEWDGRKNTRERVVNASRFRHARPRAMVDARLNTFLSR